MTTQPTHSERSATPARPRKAAPSPEPAASPDARFHIGDLCTLLESYLSAPEVAEVYRAYLFSAEAHEGQHRRSGEPYIFHPIEVARILAHMHLDGKSISAAILHDVIEDTRHGKDSIAELCRKEGIAQNLYYRWSKEFLEAGKKRLAGDTAREATSDEVKTLRAEARQLKEALAEATLENRLLKKSVIADGEDGE